MKKLLPSVTLAFASLAAFAGFASADHTFGLFTGCHCCKDCGGTITLRQYNAFSPAACGSMMFQGCVVAPPPQPPAYGFSGFSGFGGDCADGSCGGEVIGRLPNGYQGGTHSYPAPYAYGAPAPYAYGAPAPYAYGAPAQLVQMQQLQAMQQWQAMQQMQQMPAGYYQGAPIQGAQATSARVP
jgi:hypothetical protein